MELSWWVLWWHATPPDQRSFQRPWQPGLVLRVVEVGRDVITALCTGWPRYATASSFIFVRRKAPIWLCEEVFLLSSSMHASPLEAPTILYSTIFISPFTSGSFIQCISWWWWMRCDGRSQPGIWLEYTHKPTSPFWTPPLGVIAPSVYWWWQVSNSLPLEAPAARPGGDQI